MQGKAETGDKAEFAGRSSAEPVPYFMTRSPLRALHHGPRFRLGLLFAVVVWLGGCGDEPPEPLRFGLATAPVTLDPRFATDATSARINRLIYERLVEFDAQSRPTPSLGEWERVTPTFYRFTLRPSIFHDGTPLTAQDVKATYDYVLDPDNGSPHRAALSHLRYIEIVDDHTLNFFLTHPDPLFPALLVVGILPAELIAADHPFNSQPVGSGPFVFLDRPDDNLLRLRRQSDGRVFEFVRVSDPTVRVLKLLRGEIDMLQNDLPPELIRFLQSDGRVTVEEAPGSNFTYLGFNMEDPVSGDLRVRRAIAYAIDRDAIIKYVFGGAGRPAEALLPPDHWAGYKGLEGYEYDPDRARELIAEAGYSAEHPVRIIYKTSSDPLRIRLATIIQSQLADVGIDVTIRSYDWGTFYGDIKAGKFQMFSLTWVGIKSPDIFQYAFHSESVPPQGANRGHYSNPVVDRLIDAARVNSDLELQAMQYRTLQKLLLQELPYVPLWYEDHVFVARDDLEGYTVALDGNYDGLAEVHRRGEDAPARPHTGELAAHE